MRWNVCVPQSSRPKRELSDRMSFSVVETSADLRHDFTDVLVADCPRERKIRTLRVLAMVTKRKVESVWTLERVATT